MTRRYEGPARKRYTGDRERALRLDGLGRKVLGALAHLRALGSRLPVLTWRGEDGIVVRAEIVGGQHQYTIHAPPLGEPVPERRGGLFVYTPWTLHMPVEPLGDEQIFPAVLDRGLLRAARRKTEQGEVLKVDCRALPEGFTAEDIPHREAVPSGTTFGTGVQIVSRRPNAKWVDWRGARDPVTGARSILRWPASVYSRYWACFDWGQCYSLENQSIYVGGVEYARIPDGERELLGAAFWTSAYPSVGRQLRVVTLTNPNAGQANHLWRTIKIFQRKAGLSLTTDLNNPSNPYSWYPIGQINVDPMTAANQWCVDLLFWDIDVWPVPHTPWNESGTAFIYSLDSACSIAQSTHYKVQVNQTGENTYSTTTTFLGSHDRHALGPLASMPPEDHYRMFAADWQGDEVVTLFTTAENGGGCVVGGHFVRRPLAPNLMVFDANILWADLRYDAVLYLKSEYPPFWFDGTNWHREGVHSLVFHSRFESWEQVLIAASTTDRIYSLNQEAQPWFTPADPPLELGGANPLPGAEEPMDQPVVLAWDVSADTDPEGRGHLVSVAYMIWGDGFQNYIGHELFQAFRSHNRLFGRPFGTDSPCGQEDVFLQSVSYLGSLDLPA